MKELDDYLRFLDTHIVRTAPQPIPRKFTLPNYREPAGFLPYRYLEPLMVTALCQVSKELMEKRLVGTKINLAPPYNHPRPLMTFLFPKGAVMRRQEELFALTVGRGDSTRPLVIDPDFVQVKGRFRDGESVVMLPEVFMPGEMVTMWAIVINHAATGTGKFASSIRYWYVSALYDGDLGEFIQARLSGMDDKEDAADLSLMCQLAFNLMLVIQERPNLVAERQKIRVVKKKSGDRETLWSPRMVGQDYMPPRARMPAVGTHASPEMHWRDGHWRWQAHGEKRGLRKHIFIDPILVNG